MSRCTAMIVRGFVFNLQRYTINGNNQAQYRPFYDFLKKNNANTIITNPLQIIDLLDSGTEIPLIKKAKEAS